MRNSIGHGSFIDYGKYLFFNLNSFLPKRDKKKIKLQKNKERTITEKLNDVIDKLSLN